MKKVVYLAPLLFLFLFVSCILDDNYDYPRKVTFEKEGGTKICSGTSGFSNVHIIDNNRHGSSTITDVESDSIVTTYDWLTVRCKKYKGAPVRITALPNTTGKKRILYVHGTVFSHWAEIKVIQN